jgi:hypothetical protein
MRRLVNAPPKAHDEMKVGQPAKKKVAARGRHVMNSAPNQKKLNSWRLLQLVGFERISFPFVLASF